MRNSQNAVYPPPARHFAPVFAVLCSLGLITLVLVPACSRAVQPLKSVPSNGEWREFQGTWTAAGSRNTMQLGGDRRVSISIVDGSLMLAGPARPNVGFRSEAITFGDSLTGMIGRAVWTDEHGDQVYSELRGEGTAKDNKITGTFLGGTGRYLGITGEYEFSWRFVLENEDGVVQGQSMGLRGRARIEPQQLGATVGAPLS